MLRSNNAIGRERNEKALEELAKAPWTPRQLVRLGIYPNTDIARKKLNINQERGLVQNVGNVDIHGHWEFLWFCGQIQHRQHEAEISEIQLGIKGDDIEIRRLYDVDSAFRADAEIYQGGRLIYVWEHESSGKQNNRLLREKMERYEPQPQYVIWTCRNQTYLDKVARLATTDRHLFTTTELAMDDFHGEIWVDRNGKRYSLPFPDRTTGESTSAG